MPTSFVRFVLGHKIYSNWKPAVVAIEIDPQVKRAWSYKRLCKHINENHINFEYQTQLDELKEMYDRKIAEGEEDTEYA